MSIEVQLADLAEEVARRQAGYLITAQADRRPHVMQSVFEIENATLRTSTGRSGTANIQANPLVTLMWSPTAASEYSLIVDGEATASASGEVEIEAKSAVLHRRAG